MNTKLLLTEQTIIVCMTADRGHFSTYKVHHIVEPGKYVNEQQDIYSCSHAA